jgi:hypothetical protein
LTSVPEQILTIFFLFAFAAFWLIFTTLLAYLSGWFRLTDQYPDRAEEPMLRLRCQSGTMVLGAARRASMRGILTFSVCPSGLRVGMMRAFGPLCRDFFVPWERLAIIRENGGWLLGSIAELQFPNPVRATLRISGYTADRLARVAGERWPEAGPFLQEKWGDHARRLLAHWAVVTSFFALFFIVVPLAVAPGGSRPPILLAILFPALFFGVGFVVRFFFERR